MFHTIILDSMVRFFFDDWYITIGISNSRYIHITLFDFEKAVIGNDINGPNVFLVPLC